MMQKLEIVTGTLTGVDFNSDGRISLIELKPRNGKRKTIYLPNSRYLTGADEKLAIQCAESIEYLESFSTPLTAVCWIGEEGELVARTIMQKGYSIPLSICNLADDEYNGKVSEIRSCADDCEW